MTYTVGSYLARRLQQIGLKHHFAVAGDFNLVLLDQLLTIKELEQVYCCNERTAATAPRATHALVGWPPR
jgi:pyruvate decarboxylase